MESLHTIQTLLQKLIQVLWQIVSMVDQHLFKKGFQ